MLIRRLYEKLKDKLSEYCFGFDEQQLDVGFFGGGANLTDLIFQPKKINELLEEQNLPFSLKAGMIGRLDISVSFPHIEHQKINIKLQISAWKIFSESMSVNIEDVYFILGPRTSHMSKKDVSRASL